jgi:ribosomal protein L37AE/L43A
MSTQFPPSDFVQTQSAVPGILVYQPRPPEETHQEVVDFTCPQCAASKAYSAENGALTCTFCGYFEEPEKEIVGRGAEEFEFTVETVERASHGWGTERKELVCNSCAAHTTLSTDMLSHTCPFCASNQVMQVKAPQDVLRPAVYDPVQDD